MPVNQLIYNSSSDHHPHDYYNNSNYYNGYMDGQGEYNPASLLALCAALYVIIFLLGLMGNIAVIVVVLQCRSMRTSINLLFLNLCLADLFALVITGPTVIVDMYAKEVWYLGPFMCKLVTFLENVVANASAVTILAISVERHRVACKASANTTSICSVCKSFLAIWVTSLIGNIPFLFIAELEEGNLKGPAEAKVWRCVTPIELLWHKAFIVVSTLLFFILPLLVILWLYTKVYMKLMVLFRHERAKHLTYPREIVRLKRQMTQIIVTVVLVFFICHTPYRTIALWITFSPPHALTAISIESYFTMIYLTRILLYSNHAINPFVYNFVSRKFRRALLWIFCERRRRNARMDEWRDLVHNGNPIRLESLRQPRQRLFDIDNNLKDKELRGDVEAADCSCMVDRLTNHQQRNDFLVLYENLLLE